MTAKRIAWTLTYILGAIAGLHAYWALGGLWPGHDTQSLINTVMGDARIIQMPAPWMTWDVVVAPLVASGLALSTAEVWRLGRRWLVSTPKDVSWLTAFLVAGVVSCGGMTGEPPYGDPGAPLAALSPEQLALFEQGRALFDQDVTEAQGLGPTFNQRRCSSCHDLPTLGGSGVERVLKATRWADGVCDLLMHEGGDNVQPRVTSTFAALGGTGESIPPSATHTIDMVAPALYGAGLIEAIPESVILSRVDSADADGDGISGRVGRDSLGRVARFGQKATDATLRDFVEGALLAELGGTSSARMDESTRNGVPVPTTADPAADPEFSDDQVAALVAYVRYLAAPAPLRPTTPVDSTRLREGRSAFRQIGCVNCHVPTLTTGQDVDAPFKQQTVPLFSDLLLHDLGEEGAGICSGSASPTEVRTAPLMGLRLRPLLLHDGSAPTMGAVIARHGGEGARSRDAFNRLSQEHQAALLYFLSTL